MIPMHKPRVLFVCTHNSSRSQMAEGLLRHIFGDHYEVHSAGTEPSAVSPFAVSAMKEIGIDISHHTSKGVDEFLSVNLDTVVTCLLYTSPSPRDRTRSRMPSSA